jgi:uncharacterized Fe-S cluster-containing radical SAM superfamily protein
MSTSDNHNLFPALQLTDACNKNCTVCLRSPEATKHHLSYAEFRRYLDDLNRLSKQFAIKYQFITGGEPTLWKEGGKDIIDVLAEVRALDGVGIVTMPSNGKVFEDLNFARAWLSRLSERLKRPIVLGISIAAYQNNFDGTRSAALDNILSVCREPGIKVLPIILVTLGKDDEFSAALEKAYPLMPQRVTALAPLGKASAMSDACPSLSLQGSDKTSLGTFMAHFKKDVTEKLGLSDEQFFAMPNAGVMNRLSFFNNCGTSPFVKARWHYCLPFLEDPDFDLCAIGEMGTRTIDDFLATRPWLNQIRRHGVIDAVTRNLDVLSKRTRESVERIIQGAVPVSVAYRGCMVCKQFHDLGVWKELQEKFDGTH